MNRSPEKVLSYLAGHDKIDAVTVDDLQKLVAESPYFPVSQFLLAAKLKGKNEMEYLSQVQKTSVYFSNPYWLQYQLTDGHIPKDAYQQSWGETIIEDRPEDAPEKTGTSIIEEAHPVTTHFSSDELVAASDLAHETLHETPDKNAVPVNNNGDEIINAPGDVEAIEDVTAGQVSTPQADEELATITRNTNEAAESFISHLDTDPVITGHVNQPVSENLPAAVATEVTEQEAEMAGVSHPADRTAEDFLEDLTEPGKKDELLQQDEHDKMFENIKAMLDASSEEADADTKNAVIPIDPYYTIDYFASQGIKLELDQNPNDQLGQNLKKFTQWLKHMKKLGPEDATELINRTETEADIQQIADSSNTVREVVTEAMASVLEKQGKKDKAIELYNKLSFLNPDKSAYFADKIKKLKGF